jgi:hypothetical protein
MVRFVSSWLAVVFALALATSASAGGNNYEPTHPPRITAAPADATSFYLEVRARNEVGGYGHTYVTLGAIDASGQGHQTVVVGFMPRSADDDHWSRLGLPVTGWVGLTRSDISQRPNARFRIALDKETYLRVVGEIRNLRKTWTRYELVARNCNNFAGEIASSVGLRPPPMTAQYPVDYVTELRTLNAPTISKKLTKTHP